MKSSKRLCCVQQGCRERAQRVGGRSVQHHQGLPALVRAVLRHCKRRQGEEGTPEEVAYSAARKPPPNGSSPGISGAGAHQQHACMDGAPQPHTTPYQTRIEQDCHPPEPRKDSAIAPRWCLASRNPKGTETNKNKRLHPPEPRKNSAMAPRWCLAMTTAAAPSASARLQMASPMESLSVRKCTISLQAGGGWRGRGRAWMCVGMGCSPMESATPPSQPRHDATPATHT